MPGTPNTKLALPENTSLLPVSEKAVPIYVLVYLHFLFNEASESVFFSSFNEAKESAFFSCCRPKNYKMHELLHAK